MDGRSMITLAARTTMHMTLKARQQQPLAANEARRLCQEFNRNRFMTGCGLDKTIKNL
jgi:hypothetical protein